MELLLVLIFASSLFQLTAEAKLVEAQETEEEDDLFELPPDPNPVSGYADGPLPKFIELNLQVKYDLTLLEWFGGSKEETENYVTSVLHLAEFHLQYTNLDIEIHIKVLLVLLYQNKSMYVCLFKSVLIDWRITLHGSLLITYLLKCDKSNVSKKGFENRCSNV